MQIVLVGSRSQSLNDYQRSELDRHLEVIEKVLG